MNRQINSTKTTPSRFKAVCNAVQWCLAYFRPFANSFSGVIYRQHNIVSAVSLLGFHCCPTHVSFFVMTIWIYAVNGVIAVWFFADFIKEIFKSVKAKFNTATAIILELFSVWVAATRFCLRKRPVFCGQLTVYCLAVLCCSVFSAFFKKAAAGFGFITDKALSQYFRCVAAIAFAKPITTFADLSGKTDYYNAGKSLTFKVIKAAVRWFGLKRDVRIRNKHKFLLNRNLCSGLRKDHESFFNPFSILPQNI